MRTATAELSNRVQAGCQEVVSALREATTDEHGLDRDPRPATRLTPALGRGSEEDDPEAGQPESLADRAPWSRSQVMRASRPVSSPSAASRGVLSPHEGVPFRPAPRARRYSAVRR